MLLQLGLALLAPVEHGAHPLAQQADRLQRPHHHLAVGDLAGIVPADQVDAMDLDAVDPGGEYQHRFMAADDLARIAEPAACAAVVQLSPSW